MKTKIKKIVSMCCAVLSAAIIMSAAFAGCNFGNSDTTTDPVVYTIQYTDDEGTHTIEVESGDPYSIQSIPQREGYDFMGLYDSETGGTQYVSANGSSVTPFNDNKNIILFPQYKAKEYTVILDYGGAPVTGARQLTATYGESLPELPINLTLDHSIFSGWYTAENCGGTQVADEYGLIPLVSVVNSRNFDLFSSSITLYAGFVVQQFTVTFNFGGDIKPEEMKVDYGTPIAQAVPDTRNDDGQAVLTWSRTEDGSQIFNGNITEDTTLYAVEWAPVIEFDANGGNLVSPIVAREGTSVTLPVPTRTNYKFMGWQTSDGKTAQIATMPASGASLTAKWQAMLILDENGGTEVDDISQAAGTAITLPIPEKDGYIFAGWYTSDKTQYTSSSMPAASIELKAGWYKAEEKTQILLAETSTVKLSDKNFRSTSKTYSIDLNELMDKYYDGVILTLQLHFQFMNEDNTGYYDIALTNSTSISTITTYWEDKIYANGFFKRLVLNFQTSSL